MTTKNNNTSPEVKEAMKTRPAYIRTTLAAAALLTAACDVDMYEREICTYTVQLQYRYNEENTSSDNRIVYWVQHIDEYIFDGDGVLCSIRRVTEPMCDEHLNSEMQLEAGRYTVIAVGNADDQSLVYDSGNGRVEPVIGVTRRENLHMSLHEPEVYPSGRSGPCEELFYGYATFTVREIGATRVSVDVINAHFQVRYTVRWKTPPVSSTRAEVDYGTYYAVVDEIPSVYHLMPEYLYDQGSFDYTEHDPDRHDDYPVEDHRVTHYIPHAAYDDLNPHTHGNLTYMNADRQVSGQFAHSMEGRHSGNFAGSRPTASMNSVDQRMLTLSKAVVPAASEESVTIRPERRNFR